MWHQEHTVTWPQHQLTQCAEQLLGKRFSLSRDGLGTAHSAAAPCVKPWVWSYLLPPGTLCDVVSLQVIHSCHEFVTSLYPGDNSKDTVQKKLRHRDIWVRFRRFSKELTLDSLTWQGNLEQFSYAQLLQHNILAPWEKQRSHLVVQVTLLRWSFKQPIQWPLLDTSPPLATALSLHRQCRFRYFPISEQLFFPSAWVEAELEASHPLQTDLTIVPPTPAPLRSALCHVSFSFCSWLQPLSSPSRIFTHCQLFQIGFFQPLPFYHFWRDRSLCLQWGITTTARPVQQLWPLESQRLTTKSIRDSEVDSVASSWRTGGRHRCIS